MNRKLLLGLGLPVCLMLLASAAWFIGANQIDAEIDAWIAQQRQSGIDFRYDTRRIGGFPFRFTTSLGNPSIAAANPERTGLRWSWKAPGLDIDYRLFSGHLTFIATGQQELRVIHDKDAHLVLIDSAVALAAVPLAAVSDDPVVVDLTTPRITLDEPPMIVNAEHARVALTRHDVPVGDPLLNAADLAISLKQLDVVAAGKDALGVATSWDVVARIMGAIPAGRAKDSIPAWRDAGGTLDVSSLRITSGDIAVSGSGTFALDSANRLIGAMSARVQDYDLAIDKLVAAGRIREKDALFARIVLAALARPDGDSGKTTLDVPITAQDGWLNVGPVRLIALTPIRLD